MLIQISLIVRSPNNACSKYSVTIWNLTLIKDVSYLAEKHHKQGLKAHHNNTIGYGTILFHVLFAQK